VSLVRLCVAVTEAEPGSCAPQSVCVERREFLIVAAGVLGGTWAEAARAEDAVAAKVGWREDGMA